jgi:hypothetical protein
MTSERNFGNLQRNVFGPVSNSHCGLVLAIKANPSKKFTVADKKVESAVDNGRMFLMNNLIKHSAETFENEMATRALFTRDLMLSIMQDENFQP